MIKTTTHIDPLTLTEVAAGRKDPRTCVGQTRYENERTGRVEWDNLYVHFEDGLDGDLTPRVKNGKFRLNHRPQV